MDPGRLPDPQALALVPFGWSEVVGRDLVAGAAAGLSGTFSFICLYKSFTLGPISLLAPVAAMLSAVIPTLVGVVQGERLSTVNTAGVVVSPVAIVLVSQDRSGFAIDGHDPRSTALGFGLAALAGTGFSIFFLALAETEPAAGLWPLVVARLVSVPVVSLLAIALSGSLVAATGNARILLLGGLGEAAANVCATAAYQRGLRPPHPHRAFRTSRPPDGASTDKSLLPRGRQRLKVREG